MMRKVAVFTLQGPGNYGNRLQNFAVESILKTMGWEVDSIIPTNHMFLKPLEVKLKILFDLIFGNSRKKKEAKRKIIFLNFDRRHMNLKYVNLHCLEKLNNVYALFIAGSDQVWNPAFDPKGIFLLPFAKRRACICPSIGVEVLKEEDAKRFSRELKYFRFLSTREESGKRILENLLNRKVVRLIDPTMYLSSEVWAKMEKKPKGFHSRKYIFCYNLGTEEIAKSDIARSIKKKYQCNICSIYDEKHENTILAGPEEFIWLLHHAKFVISDSYHAIVFSILFHKDFLVYEREGGGPNMSTRFETLLTLFGFNDKYYKKEKRYNIDNYDFSKAEKILDRERKRMKGYLDQCFKE